MLLGLLLLLRVGAGVIPSLFQASHGSKLTATAQLRWWRR